MRAEARHRRRRDLTRAELARVEARHCGNRLLPWEQREVLGVKSNALWRQLACLSGGGAGAARALLQRGGNVTTPHRREGGFIAALFVPLIAVIRTPYLGFSYPLLRLFVPLASY